MARFGMLLSLLLLVGLVACETDSGTPAVDAGQIDAVLSEYSADRAAVMSAISDARGMELATSATLDQAAARHALDLAHHRTATHMGQDGSSPHQRMHEAGGDMRHVREFIFRIEGDPEDLGAAAATTWLAPHDQNAVLTEPCTHAAVAFAPLEEGGCVGVLLLAQR